ncbi:hypothetical protein GOP47_0010496 [Adiantum capillus-veneris]|uniref:YLP motif-containing protein 1 n=1 Tax=Adiantum capillus-veneris TaxID=13818 RepID=A0A9D4UUT2_ADICA|nr:hypothetical protein GOP47_0010496 [Adiantum capillus-veneris]
METFRLPFPTSVPHQLCPTCMAPHFPFCPQHHVPMGHPPQRYESIYSGQQAPQMHHGVFNPHSEGPFGRGLHPLPDPHFQVGRPTELNPHQSYVPHGHPPHFGEDRRDRVPYGPFQSGVSRFPLSDDRNHSSNGAMYIDPWLGGQNARIEAERDFAYHQQRRYAGMGERIESGERFLPRLHAAEPPRVDANIRIPENRFERGFRSEYYGTSEDARLGMDMTKHHYGMASFNSVGHGRGEYEPLNDALGDHMHGNNLPSHLNATQGSYDSHGAQVFVSNRQKLSTAGVYNALGVDEKCYESVRLQRREEEALTDQNRFSQPDAKREDDLVHQRCFQTETYGHREEMQAQDNMDVAPVKKGLKRKHGQQALSREEELLIEKGLLDDDLSEGQLHESFACQVQQENDQFMSKHKQGGHEEKENYYQQLGYQSSEPCSETGTLGNKFGEPGDNKYESMQYSSLKISLPDRQYLEWEAEEKHMEALRRAERLAREIQQREEVTGICQLSSGQSEYLCKQEVAQDSSIQAYHQHREKIRAESAEANLEHNKIECVSQTHSKPLQHQTHQNTRFYSERLPQQHARDSFVHDVQLAEAYGQLQPRQHDSLVQPPATSPQSQWLKEQTSYQPHLGPQRNSQPLSHHDQQSTSSRLVHSLYSRSAAEEPCQERTDRGSSLSVHTQLGSGIAHDFPGSFPPLPSAASVNPPPPDSPPPPLPPSHPPFNEAPPPPPTVAAYPSARWNTLQGSLENSQQRLPPDSQGLHDFHSVHMGVSQAHHLSQFHPQPLQPLEKSKVVDAVHVFRNPSRLTRPDRFVVILRGLPGSGKSYFAKALRDVEVMNGGSAPRIHSMDDYFTCEVEKEEEIESGSSRTKKKVVKRVMEYCYEPEMEEAYRASMLKAFRKTLEEGMFKFVVVDDRNVLIADFAQFWAIAKRSGYEAYILEAPYSDVKGCAARNVHNFTEQQIQSMKERWESTPSLYLKMDVSSLFRADDLNAQDIIEVDMDADDMERDLEEEEEENNQSAQDHPLSLDSERPVSGDRWEDKVDPEEKIPLSAKFRPPLKVASHTGTRRKSTDNALSGLMTTYGKKDKFVHWSDNQGVKGSSIGFSIGSSSHKTSSLVIGPGPGYNGVSNLPVTGDDPTIENPEMRKSNKFVEQLRAEQEAFKAVFVGRRQRIGGMDDELDD